MKLSTITWLSKAIALPLFMTMLNISPASAEQIDRSQRISFDESRTRASEFLPSATDLNLRVPAPSSTMAPNDREPSNSIDPIWANPDRDRPSTTVIKRKIKTKLIPKKRDLSSTNIKSSISLNNEKSSTVRSTSKRRDLVAKNIESASPTIGRGNSKQKYPSSQKIAAISRPPFSGNYLRLVRDPSKGTNNVGNPIYTLEAYIDGQKYQTFDVVSGTANTQTADRNKGNNSAPLPDGLYSVSDRIIPGITPEVGKTFIGIFPKFETGRNSLGIHLDRSFNQSNGYDGTAGCIGITTPADRDAINGFIIKYHPQNLFVSILSSPN
jgi:hypothetical protein